VRPASDFDRIAPHLALWHGYDPAVKADLYSTCVLTPRGAYLVDPIPLQSETLDELLGSSRVSGIIVTSSNHHRASAQFAEQFSIPVFARCETFSGKMPRQFNELVDGDKICDELQVIDIESAGPGEIALHYAPNGGTLIVGDALINFEPYGFTFLPAKYCSNAKEMRRSLRKLLRYKAERMLFAHGSPILSAASDRLHGLLGSDFRVPGNTD
jgi:glyoxylase-like metal-dependent hydrolase (beta-lactamase superfamily II)